MKALLTRTARSVTAPGIFLCLIAYALWSSTQGPHGLQAMAVRQGQLTALNKELDRLRADELAWVRNVNELAGPMLDPDMLDERARMQANMVESNDVIVQYPSSKRAAQ